MRGSTRPLASRDAICRDAFAAAGNVGICAQLVAVVLDVDPFHASGECEEERVQNAEWPVVARKSAQEAADSAPKLGFGFEPSLVGRLEDVLHELPHVRTIGLRKFGEERVEPRTALADEAEQPVLLA